MCTTFMINTPRMKSGSIKRDFARKVRLVCYDVRKIHYQAIWWLNDWKVRPTT
jgi:hypothetical protein